MGRGYETGEEGVAASALPSARRRQAAFLEVEGLRYFCRFGVLQTENLRGCDALKRPTTNLACTVEAPTQLVSWGNIAQLSYLLSAKGGD